MALLIDWSTVGTPNPTDSVTITDGDQSTDVTITSDPDVFYDAPTETLSVSGLPNDTSQTTTLNFNTEVQNVTFEIFDLDAAPTFFFFEGWDDQITIRAFDADGNPVDITFSDLESYHVETGNTVEANGNTSRGVEGSGAPDSITVTIPGPVSRIEVIFETGSSDLSSGVIRLSDIEGDIVCFALGTHIQTSNGPRKIETLTTGARVTTSDGRQEPIRWIGSRTVPASGKFAPIVFAPRAIGNARDLVLSPQHRVLVTGWQAQLLFGEDEVLVAAKHLVNGDTIYRREGAEITYFHLLFDRHEIVLSEGVPTESFHPGQLGLDGMEEDQAEEIYALFPELRDDVANYGPSRVPSLKAYEGQLLSS